MRRHLKSSLANATPATDGKRVVVLFGTVGVLAAYDFDGKRALAAGRRRPRLQRPAGRHRRVGPRQLADPLRRPRDRAGRPPQGLVPRRLPPGGRRARPGAWRATSPPPGRRPTCCARPRATSCVTNGQTIRAYDPRDGQAALDPRAELRGRGRDAGRGRRAWRSSPPAIRPCGPSTRCAPGQRGDLTPARRPALERRHRLEPRRAAAPTSRRRSSTAATSTP